MNEKKEEKGGGRGESGGRKNENLIVHFFGEESLFNKSSPVCC